MTTSLYERRFTKSPVEVRAKGDRPKIGGYAARFNSPSQNLGGFVEVVDPGFFNKSRGDGWPDVMARYNHDDNMLLGTTASGMLTLETDNLGLLYEVVPPQARADIVELVERGDVRKSSFAFRVYEDDWAITEQGFPKRTLLSGQLVDVAPVNMPAYLDTSVGLREDYLNAALRTLAEKVDAPLEEVRALAEKEELKRLLVKTPTGSDPTKPPELGAKALMDLLAKEQPPV